MSQSTDSSHSSPDSLQFERAESTQPAGIGVVCAGCKQPIPDVYFEINQKSFCSPCRDGLASLLNSGFHAGTFLRAAVVGAAAAALGAGIWFTVARLTGYNFGLIAIVVGLMVGKSIRWATGGRGGLPYQLLAMLLTYLSITMTEIPPLLDAVQQQNGTDAGSISLLGWLILLKIAFTAPFLGGIQNIMGLVIIGIALYEAWRFTQGLPITIAGPYPVGGHRSSPPPAN